MGNLTINNGGIIINSDTLPNVDLRYGPYNSIEDANTALNGHKIPGLTVGIKQAGGIIKEYWYQYENGILTLTPTITNEGTTTGINVAGREITPDANGTITLPIDTTPKDGSTNIITSGAVYSGLGGKQDNIQDLNQIRSNATTAIQPGTLASTLGDIEISRTEQYDIAANLTNRTADIDQQTSEVKALGYKVLNPSLSFAEQVESTQTVDNSNMIFEIRDEFDLNGGSVTLPAGSVLKHNGGVLKNGTINVNKISIESTKPIFGENVVVIGRPLQEASPEWFTGSDADKIQRAIECFSSIRLAPRTYNIDRPILISQSFALKGSGIGEFFASDYPSNSVNSRMSILTASDNASGYIDTILWIIGNSAPDIPTGYSPRKNYISAVIDGVCFMGSGYRHSDGIRWSTPGGPSRPIDISNCTFSLLRHGIHVYGSTTNSSTNFGDVQISSCNFNGNVWGLWFDGNHGINSVVIKGCTLEGNHSDDYTTGGGIYTEGANTVYGTFFMIANDLEGQPYGVVLRGEAMQIYLIGNYFEWGGHEQKNIVSSTNTYKSSILLDNKAVTGASGVSFDLVNLDVMFVSKIGLNENFTYNLRKCYVKTDLIGKLGKVDLGFVDKKDNEIIVQQSNIVSTFSRTTSTAIPTFQSKVFYQVDGFPSFANPILDGYVQVNSKYVSGFTGEIGADSNLKLIFYARNSSLANPIIVRMGVIKNGVTTTSEIISTNIPYTNGKLVLFNLDLKPYIESYITEETQSLNFNVLFRGEASIYISRPLLVKGTYTSFVGYDLLDYVCSTDVLKNPREGYIYPLGNYKRYKSDRFVDPYGFTAVSRITGSTANRPTNLVSGIDLHFRYHDTDISKDIFANFSKSSVVALTKTISTGRTGEVATNTLSGGKEYQFESTIASTDGCKIAFRKTDSTNYTENDEIVLLNTLFRDLPIKIVAPDPTEYPYIYFWNGRPTGNYAAKFNVYEIILTWKDSYGFTPALSIGTTSQRPTNLVSSDKGFEYIDINLGQHIFWNGTSWVDANGEAIELTVSDTTVLIGSAVNSTASVNVYYAGSTAPTIDVLNPDNTANNWLIATLTGNTLALTLDGTNGANTTTSPRGAKIIITLGTEVVIINVVQAAGSSN